MCVLWQCVPEVPVELPLLPGSLLLPVVVELQTHSDEELQQGQGPQEPVAAPDGAVIALEARHTQLYTHKHTSLVVTSSCN